ncbi:MAG: PTS transporter subunit EIIC [Anaerorhabdus sp.]|uniref:PTS sugar transporter subunit IIC n=1 Tax=Anaerorhabdus sp. TaxID=1872524 RepID=UPI002FCB6B36
MEKFFNKLEEKLMPMANFFGNQRHFIAIRDGIVSAIPFTIVGSLFLLLASPPVDANTITGIAFLDSFFQGWLSWATVNAQAILAPFDATMGIMSVFICCAVAYSLAKSYEKKAIHYVLCTLSVYILLVSPIENGIILTRAFQSRGILLAVFVALISVELMKFVENKGWTIHLPKGVPPVVANSFSTLFPFMFALIIMYLVSLFCQMTTGKLIPDLFFTMFQNVKAGVDNIYIVSILIGLETLLFGFGVHPTTVVGAVLNPISLMNTASNAELVARGLAASHVYTDPFFNFYIGAGGAGATLALCFLLLRSRSKQLKEVGKVAIIPCIFNINEPLIFGLPIFLNPIMIIPFVIVPTVNTIIGWILTSTGVVAAAYINAPWTAPAPIGAFLSTLDWKAGVMVLALIVIDGFIYFPFMKIYEKRKMKEEKEEIDLKEEVKCTITEK